MIQKTELGTFLNAIIVDKFLPEFRSVFKCFKHYGENKKNH